ncbi:MAG: hypothetical protein MW690_001643 [Methanophagales archaeon]|nr:hypothetical protein [Methanophagales archaeon]
MSVKFNGNELGPLHLEGVNDNNPNVWATTHGKYWWWYNVTNRVNAGTNKHSERIKNQWND